MWGRRNLDLDTWATALGVDNDTDAIAALRVLNSRLDALAGELAQLMRGLPEGGKWGTPAGDARDYVSTSIEGLHETKDRLQVMTQAFGRHERGES